MYPETVLLLSRRYDHAFTKKYPLKVYGGQYLKGLASAWSFLESLEPVQC